MIPGCTAEGGDIAGMNNLATCYANGTGVAINPGRTMRLYRQAARAGYSIAQHNLGGVYCKGQIIPRDLKLAVMWYKRATAQGVYQSDYWLGAIYDYQGGREKAVKHMRTAAAHHEPDAVA